MDTTILNGKKVLVVDDEEDILETLRELLDMCAVDTASDFESAKNLIHTTTYDCAVFDIMGVNGYALLHLARKRNIPALMLTAHALSPEHLITAIQGGAHAYLPKHTIADIASYMADMLTDLERGKDKSATWFARLKPTFDEHFGEGWQKKDKQFWRDFAEHYVVTHEELRQVL